jgi:protoheme ferro-lyase
MNREEGIKKLEFIQRKERLEQEYKLLYADSPNLPINEMSSERLQDKLAVLHGLPLGTRYSAEQLKARLRLLRARQAESAASRPPASL